MVQEKSRDYLEQALTLAKSQLPGWAWAMIHQAARGYAGGKVRSPLIKKKNPYSLREGSKIVFVVAEHNELEKARGKLLVGADGVTFRERYLKELSLNRREVDVCTVDQLPEELGGRAVVALGKAAKAALGDKANHSMPHPTAVRKLGDSGEVNRKAKALKKILTKAALSCDNLSERAESKSPPSVEVAVSIAKADSEKRIVYGVVLDPYGGADTQGDLIDPSEVEKTAHGWMSKSRVIGLQHSEMANATPVESWLVPYPTDEDYKNAMAGKPHKANRQIFGKDMVHSGTWILGVRLGEKEWAAVKSGELNAYSIGGFGKRKALSGQDAPKVVFIDEASFSGDKKRDKTTAM